MNGNNGTGGMPSLYFMIRPTTLTQDYVMGIDPAEHPGAVVLRHVDTDPESTLPFPYNMNPDASMLWRLVYTPPVQFALVNKMTHEAVVWMGPNSPLGLGPVGAPHSMTPWNLSDANTSPVAVRPSADTDQNLNVWGGAAEGTVIGTSSWNGGAPGEVWDFLPFFVDDDQDDSLELAFFSLIYCELAVGAARVAAQDQGAAQYPLVTAWVNIAEYTYDDNLLFALMFWPGLNGAAIVSKSSGNMLIYPGEQERPIGTVPFFNAITDKATGRTFKLCNIAPGSAWRLLWRFEDSASFVVQWQQTDQSLNVPDGDGSNGTPIITWNTDEDEPNASWTFQDVPYWYDTDAQPPATLAELEELVKKVAPIVYLDPSDAYFSCSADWFLGQATLGINGTPNAAYDVWTLSNGTLEKTQDNGNPPPESYYFTSIPQSAYGGSPATTTFYVYVKDYQRGYLDVQFWLFCAYNGSGYARLTNTLGNTKDFDMAPLGRHTGDWEHVTLRVSYTGNPIAAYCSQHDGGEIYLATSLGTEGGRPVVYASRHGHAFGIYPGAQLYEQHWYGVAEFALVNYFGAGRRFDVAATPITIIGANTVNGSGVTPMYPGAIQPPSWLDFPGDWGPSEKRLTPPDSTINAMQSFLIGGAPIPPSWLRDRIGDLRRDGSGPTGPRFKDSWSQNNELV